MRHTLISLALLACGGKHAEVPPETVAANQHGPQQVVVHDGYAYWTQYGTVELTPDPAQPGTISRAKLGGGAVEVVRDHLGHPRELVATDTALYWADLGAHAVMRAAFSGGEPTVWADQDGIAGLAVAGDVAYWTRQAGGHDELVRTSGASVEVVAQLPARASELVATATEVDVALADQVVRVVGGKVSVIARDQATPSAIARLGDRVVWTNCDDATLRGTTADGAEVLAEFPRKSCPSSITIVGETPYVATSNDGGVWEVKRGKAQRLAHGDLFAQGITADATHVYWANNGSKDGSVLRVAR